MHCWQFVMARKSVVCYENKVRRKAMIEHLLQPGDFGKLKVKNRIVYPGMTFKLRTFDTSGS